jgi:hypothetical protein
MVMLMAVRTVSVTVTATAMATVMATGMLLAIVAVWEDRTHSCESEYFFMCAASAQF